MEKSSSSVQQRSVCRLERRFDSGVRHGAQTVSAVRMPAVWTGQKLRFRRRKVWLFSVGAIVTSLWGGTADEISGQLTHREQRVERHLHQAALLLWAALARWIRRRQGVQYIYLTHRLLKKESFYILNFSWLLKENWLSVHFEDPVFLEHRFLQCQRLHQSTRYIWS